VGNLSKNCNKVRIPYQLDIYIYIYIYIYISPFNVLGEYHERARKGKVVVLSLLTLREHLCYACVYV